jgi:fibro-slime domain-containing protein
MKASPTRHYEIHGIAPAISMWIALAPTLAAAMVACTDPTIQDPGGGGDATQGGAGGSNTGGTFAINTSVPTSTGGTTGAACSGTSTSGCKATTPPACGDALNNQPGEECDDGNVLPGDGCNGVCRVEPNWTCPRQGKCVRHAGCGDGKIGPGEVCDDGNAIDGDGCSSDCTAQDPAYKCNPPGQPCVRISQCGNKRVEPGEKCDDGNTEGGDGCRSTCQIEAGWVCPTPGQPCKHAPRCGDGVLQPSLGEVCDDGNTLDDDGCSADCGTKGAGCACTPGKLCVCPTVVCGDGKVEGNETCDDGNTAGGDGCSSDCQLENGYVCPVVGSVCRTVCGDKKRVGNETCDDGNTVDDDGCNSHCQLEPGFVCDDSGACRMTVCGDGMKEGTEQCDDTKPGDPDVPFDGCYHCLLEPDCSIGSCKSPCGDGQRFSNEECDDGNTVSGDGCSSSCKIETGFECTDSPMTTPASTKDIPVVVRDFIGLGHQINPSSTSTGYHVDFNGHYGLAAGGPIFAMVKTMLGSNGKPAWRWQPYKPSDITTSGTPDDPPIPTPLANCKCDDTASAASWATSSETWSGGWAGAPVSFEFSRPPCSCSDGTKCTCDNPAHLYKDLGTTNSNRRNFSTPGNFEQWYTPVDGVNLVVPYVLRLTLVDAASGTYSNLDSAAATAFNPISLGGWIAAGKETAACDGKQNVSFTTELRFWFEYQGGEQFAFSGDDDAWVFINRTLVVDLGSLHGREDGSFTLDASNGSAVAKSSGRYYDGIAYSSTQGASLQLGLVLGKVYEVAMFQAERNECGSNFGVTLKNFSRPKSTCSSICGDGIVAANEYCDDGVNKSEYNGCGPNCVPAPYCGDGVVQAPDEECDDGRNISQYGGCAPGCKHGPSCGDGVVQATYGEECDDGNKNSTSTDPNAAYGACMADCQRGGHCGDGSVNGPERCDDGLNDGSYGTCNPDCTLAPRCGDGVIQEDYGEECEPTSSEDPNCTPACRKPGGCGDAVVQPPEQCDYGAQLNTGEYGGCAPGCVYAPHCGDGIVNGPEECDDGVNSGSYGGCTAQCKLGPHCGDGVVQSPPEECDNGPDNGWDGRCSAQCKNIIYLPP